MGALEEDLVVLIVEDNANDELLALRALKRADVSMRIDIARDGVEAAEYFADAGRGCPDLVLLDLKLPRMNGLEVLKRIRSEEKTRCLPVVVFTSSNEEADLIGCFDAGANSFVRKPVDFGEYMDKVAKLAEYWLTIHEPCHPGGARLAELANQTVARRV